MKLNSLTRYKKANKRVGRGRATGVGKTSGRGHGGQKSRTGKKIRAGFEGGQTPIFQRLPKYRGFKNPNHVEYQVINVGDLEALSEKTITRETLLKNRLAQRKNMPIKILGTGELSKALDVQVEKASKSAIDKITKAGGSFTSTAQEPKKTEKAAVPQASEETPETTPTAEEPAE